MTRDGPIRYSLSNVTGQLRPMFTTNAVLRPYVLKFIVISCLPQKCDVLLPEYNVYMMN